MTATSHATRIAKFIQVCQQFFGLFIVGKGAIQVPLVVEKFYALTEVLLMLSNELVLFFALLSEDVLHVVGVLPARLVQLLQNEGT